MNANTKPPSLPNDLATRSLMDSVPMPDFAGEGETFQHYQVLRRPDGTLWELGRGAMGVTYKAFDTNLRCHVALKVISAQHLHSEVAGQRFIREARVAARLRHPNIATVYHLGVDPQGFFYSMEFIDGQTLEDLLERIGPLPLDGVLQVGVQTARALAAASRQGLIHRDIKPSNLMVLDQSDDHEDEMAIKVIDFGLARSYDPSDSNARLTASGFVGTPLYASPEQLEEKDLDVRSDIYSLGVTLWVLLAGQPPFNGKMTQVITQHLNAEPPWWQLGDCPEEARVVLERMLRKDPSERYQSAGELRQALEDCRRSLRNAGKIQLGSKHVVHPLPLITGTTNGTYTGSSVSPTEVSMLSRLGTIAASAVREPVLPSAAVSTASPAPQPELLPPTQKIRSRLRLSPKRLSLASAVVVALGLIYVLSWVGSMGTTRPVQPITKSITPESILVPSATAQQSPAAAMPPVVLAPVADPALAPVAPEAKNENRGIFTPPTGKAQTLNKPEDGTRSPSTDQPPSSTPLPIDGELSTTGETVGKAVAPSASPAVDDEADGNETADNTPNPSKSPAKATAHSRVRHPVHHAPTPAPNFFQKLFGIKPKPHPR